MKNILSYIEQAGERYPDHVALADETTAYSYQEFLLLAKRIGTRVCQLGRRNRPVAVFMYYYVIMALGMLLEPLFLKLLHLLHLNRERKLYRLWQILRTFCLVNIGMLIFRADTLGTAWSMFLSMLMAQAT